MEKTTATSNAGNTIEWEGRRFEMVNVKAIRAVLQGEEVLKVERDLESFPFDPTREVETVDDRHFLKLKDFDFSDGIFEVKLLSRVQQPAPFPNSQGFIGMYYRIQQDHSAFEAIYLRPNVGRSPTGHAESCCTVFCLSRL